MTSYEITKLMDALSASWQKQRANTQMTLGGLIDRLKELPPETLVKLDSPHSYRGYYEDLAFERGAEAIPAQNAAQLCQDALGKEFTGYKGGEYMMTRGTPVWIASYGCCGMRLLSVNDDGTFELSEDND